MKKTVAVFASIVLMVTLVFSHLPFHVHAEYTDTPVNPGPTAEPYPVLFCGNCGAQLVIYATTATHYWMRCPRACMADDWIKVRK